MGDGRLGRRDFMKLAAVGAGSVLGPLGASSSAEQAPSGLSDHEALYWEAFVENGVQCKLCPRQCFVAEGLRGQCGVRENQGGVYKTLVYARPCSMHVDPIEKKPLFHFLPGARAFSIATAGCNVDCQFCQNWQISQAMPEDVKTRYVPPKKVVEMAQQQECPVIACTYSEPTIFYEYMLDTARQARKNGLHCVSISNGYIQPEPMKELCRQLSAVKIDLKAFTEDFYHRYVGATLKPVLQTIELLSKEHMYNELVVLLIPGLNDSEDEIRKMSRWVVEHVGPDVPMHFSRFHPAYKMKNLSPTPPQTVVRARQIAVEEGVHYAYVGNLPGSEYESTYCHGCGKKIITRYGFYVSEVKIKDGKCAYCGQKIPGVWE